MTDHEDSAAPPPRPELPPFEPPPDYRFEPELQGSTPRRVPEALFDGRRGRRNRNAATGMLIGGALAAVAGLLPIVRTWGLYVLPLGYLFWIGLAVVGLGVLTRLTNRSLRGPYRYVTEGRPLVARIREMVLAPTAVTNGQPSAYAFQCEIELIHPDTGELIEGIVASEEFLPDSRERLTTSFKAGDYVTAVYLPGGFDTSLRLYGFLDLKPGLGIIDRPGYQPKGPLPVIATVGVIAALFAVLGFDLYSVKRYWPLDLNLEHFLPFAIGAVTLGGAFLALLAHSVAETRRKRAERNRLAIASGEPLELAGSDKRGLFGEHGWGFAILILAGGLLLGGTTGLATGLFLNAYLDSSVPEFRPVKVVGHTQTTHTFLIREYELEYRFLDEPDEETHDLVSTPQHLSRFSQSGSGLGLATIRSGRFGWRWIETVEPLELQPGDDLDEHSTGAGKPRPYSP